MHNDIFVYSCILRFRNSIQTYENLYEIKPLFGAFLIGGKPMEKVEKLRELEAHGMWIKEKI